MTAAGNDSKLRLRVLVLSDGRPGHFNQSRGVVRALQFHYQVEEDWRELHPRTGVARAFLAGWLNLTRGNLPEWPLRGSYRCGTWPTSRPDLILSAGGNTLPVNAWLARRWRCRNLFVGTIRRLQPQCFWRVLTYQPQQPSPPFFHWKITPVPIEADELHAQGLAFRQANQLADAPLWTMLVGGNGGGYTYEPADWERLAAMLNQCAAAHQIRWLVVTSRRTGSEAEQILARQLVPASVASLSLYSQEQGTRYRDFLGAGDRVFTTEDSHMMLTEAIYSGKPVISVRPRQARPDPSNQLFLDGYVAQGFIHRHALDQPFELPTGKPTRFESPLRDLGELLHRWLTEEQR